MKTIEVKTNIKCGSCVAKFGPSISDVASKTNKKVELQNPSKTLTVNAGDITDEEVINAVKRLVISL